MTEIRLGNTDLKVKRIGFGGIPIQRLSKKEAMDVVAKALDAGIDFYDTSRIYTDSEDKMGAVLKGHYDKIVIATKSYSRDAEGVTKDIETCLSNLGTDRIDLFQLHNISKEEELEQVLGSGGAVEGLEAAQKAGKIRYIGITGHKPWILNKAIQQYDFKTLQFPFNIIENACIEELIPLAKEKGIGTIAMKPIAGGALRRVDLNLRYILTNGADVAIPGMDKIQQIPENFSVLNNLNPLSPEEMAILEKEKEDWSDNFCRRCEYCMPCPQGLNITFLHLLGVYYFRYDLKDWAWERIQSLPKKYQDCINCMECVNKCPYSLNTPEIFKETWDKILQDRSIE
jgi:predicted aldo/keto reductase-like oxidoreductase